MRNFVITSESVTSGHPDKLCDQISDAIVDAYLAGGVPRSIGAECALASGVAFLSVRAGDEAPVDLAALTRRVLADAGYGEDTPGGAPTVMIDLAPEVPAAFSQMVTAFGYACRQTAQFMPYPIWAAHGITRRLDLLRGTSGFDWLAPDAMVQVAVEFADRVPRSVPAIALRLGTSRPVETEILREILLSEVVGPVLSEGRLGFDPASRFVLLASPDPAGPPAHSGLTGRKSADDAYGTFVRRSGPSMSGKDPSRIDRIANYAARQAARSAVEAGLAGELEVQLSYIAGDRHPVSVEVDSHGSSAVPDSAISVRLRESIDFGIGAIAERLGLWDLPARHDGRFYRDLAVHGHMGRDDLSAPWDTDSLAAALA